MPPFTQSERMKMRFQRIVNLNLRKRVERREMIHMLKLWATVDWRILFYFLKTISKANSTTQHTKSGIQMLLAPSKFFKYLRAVIL